MQTNILFEVPHFNSVKKYDVDFLHWTSKRQQFVNLRNKAENLSVFQNIHIKLTINKCMMVAGAMIHSYYTIPSESKSLK